MIDRLLSLYVSAESRLTAEDGQTTIEYALVIVLVSLALATALAALSGSLDGVVQTITTALGGSSGTGSN